MTGSRAVVTGLGVIAPNGIGTEAYWAAALRGEHGIRPVRAFDASRYSTKLAGEILNLPVDQHVEPKLKQRTDRWVWITLAATAMALKDAGLDLSSLNPYDVGVVLGSGTGGNAAGQKELKKLVRKGPGGVSAFLSVIWFYAAATGQVSIFHGTKGTGSAIVSEGASGLDAVAHARRLIARGTQVVLSGGCEAPIAPFAWISQAQNGRVSRHAHPARAYVPFDEEANGYVPGEGGAIVVVEESDHARQRGAEHVYGEIAGYAATHDAFHHSAHPPDATRLARAMELAVDRAGLEPQDIDAIFADGAGTREGDELEAAAIRQVFRDQAPRIPVTVPKSMTGRLYAGGASLDVAAALLAIRDGVLPPTVNVRRMPAEYNLNLVRDRPLRTKLDAVLIAARGFGGFNSAMVLRKRRRNGNETKSDPRKE